MDRTFARIQAIQVDANDPVDPATTTARKLNPKDVQLAITTAKDLTVNKGGLLDRENQPSKLEIAVVDPVHMPRPDNNPPLDERLRGMVFGAPAPRAAVPETPIEVAATEPDATQPVALNATTKAVTIAAADEDGPRRIQIGSFGSLGAAQSAWEDLRDRYPGVTRYRPAYEKVVTASGKTMVRLKVGPVAGEAQARGLCDKLDIHDAWCAKSG